MTLQFWFWIIYVLSLVFSLWGEYTPGSPYPFPQGFKHVLFYVLVGILGLQVFGSPVK